MVKEIDIRAINQIPDLINEYLSNNDALKNFVEDFPTIENLNQFIEKKKSSYSEDYRNILVEQLKKQYSNNGIMPPSTINLLNKNTTFTVTTGHQLSLFGGPQFFIHKIISTIKTTEILKNKHPEYNFIPIFWMATEDHDYDEINQVKLFGRTISSENEATGPMGRIKCGNFNAAFNEIKLMIGESEANELLDIFENAMKSNNWAASTRYWVHHFFKDFPLVIIDGDDKELKKLFISKIKDELTKDYYKTILNTNNIIENLGYKPQVNPREINLFYMLDNIRERIVYSNNQYVVLNTNITFSEQSILSEVDQYPERFSPNVVLRPVYQESILPNLAYIGGPGETSYWLQLKNYFQKHTTPYPMVILRDFFGWISPKEIDQLNSNEIEIEDLFKNEDNLKKQLALKFTNHTIAFNDENKLISNLENMLVEKATSIDPSIEGMVKAEINNTYNFVNKLEKRLIKAIKQKEEININRILKIKNKLLPNEKLNERTESFIPLYIRYKSEYLENLHQCSNPFNAKLKLITPSN